MLTSFKGIKWGEQPDGGCVFPMAYRGLLAIAQVATVLLTWPLWQARDYPALLPLLPVPQIDVGWPLILSIVGTFFFPRIGLPVHAAVLGWAMVADQSRIQPQMLSMLYLCCGTIPASRGGVLIARASLVSLWFFSGLHKLTSPEFFTNTATWLLSSLDAPHGRAASLAFGMVVGLSEVGLAIGCLIPRARKGVAIAALVFHSSVFLVLSPLGINWNPEVLPWNAALAFSGIALIAQWRDTVPGVAWRSASRPARIAAVILLVSPIGYWLGLVDAYLAHCLYSDNTPRAFVCTPQLRRDLRFVCLDMGIPAPPAHRLFEPLFLSVGRLEEWLEIEDPRWIAKWRGLAPRKVRWSDLLPDDAEIVFPGFEGPLPHEGGGEDRRRGTDPSGFAAEPRPENGGSSATE